VELSDPDKIHLVQSEIPLAQLHSRMSDNIHQHFPPRPEEGFHFKSAKLELINYDLYVLRTPQDAPLGLPRSFDVPQHFGVDR